MNICVILRQGQKLLVPCEGNITSDALKGLFSLVFYLHAFTQFRFVFPRECKFTQ